jgi:hypothetical protein
MQADRPWRRGAPVALTQDGSPHDAVAAHGLLNSSAIVSMGIATLQERWDGLSPAQREHLLSRMAKHAASVDDGLKRLTLGNMDPAASLDRVEQDSL